MNNTSQEYDNVIAICRTLFINKMKDYGSAWRILRLPSLTDQIFIKAQRIKSIEEIDYFPEISPMCLTLFSNLMMWDPKKRWTAQQTSKSIYFDELPMPTPDNAMPRFHDRK